MSMDIDRTFFFRKNSCFERTEKNLEDVEIITARVLASLLKNAIQELTILDKISKVPHAFVNLEYVPIDVKYSIVDFEKTNHTNVCDLEAKKFQADRTFVEKILESTMRNLVDNQSFGNLLKILENYAQSKRDEEELLEDRFTIELEMERLRNLQQNDRATFFKIIKNLGDNVGNIKDQLDDARVDYEYKTRYLIRWEDSRNEQSDKIFTDKEKAQSKIISKCDIRIIREDRLHEEIVSYLTETYHDHDEAIEMWMEKYDSDLEKKDDDINKLKMQLDNQIEAHQKLQEEVIKQLKFPKFLFHPFQYESRQKQMEEYLIVKEQRTKEAKELEERIAAAIKIQAWWRGTMVRKCLGPYRKKKGKGKKGSAGKGKKKK